jgi:hypothetical protein
MTTCNYVCRLFYLCVAIDVWSDISVSHIHSQRIKNKKPRSSYIIKYVPYIERLQVQIRELNEICILHRVDLFVRWLLFRKIITCFSKFIKNLTEMERL